MKNKYGISGYVRNENDKIYWLSEYADSIIKYEPLYSEETLFNFSD